MSETKYTQPIPGYAGYAATEDGEIVSINEWRGQACRTLHQLENGRGYLKVRVSTPSGRRNVPVHKLVALAYLHPRPSPAHEIRHLDGDRHNNAATNLARGTRKDNADDRERHGRTSRGNEQSTSIKNGLARKALLAAAPDLLAACEAIIEHQDHECSTCEEEREACEKLFELYHRSCDLARAAIAKAKGTKP